MKIAGIVLIGIVVIIVALSFIKDTIVKISVEGMVKAVAGLRMDIGGLSMSILKTDIDIRGLRLFNPKGFRDKVMLDMPEIFVDYDLPSIFKDIIHLKYVKIDMKELVVLKNERGELNLNSIKFVKANKEGKKAVEPKKDAASQMRIDHLHLKVGKVIYKDYSQGAEPVVKVFNINIDEEYTDITSLQALAGLLMAKALARTTIAELTNFNIKLLNTTVSKTIERAGKLATGAADATGRTIGGVFEGLKDTLKLNAQE